MRVCHFTEREGMVLGGIQTSLRNQRRALEDLDGVELVRDPDEPHDVLHLNLLGPRSMLRMWRAKRAGTPVLVHAHTTAEDFRDSMRFSNLLAPLVDRYTRFVYERADALVAPSAYTARLLRSKGLTPPVHVVSNGIDPGRLAGWETVDPPEPGLDERFVVMNLGLVFERKGLATWTELARRMPDAAFRWYGPRLSRWLRSGRTTRLVRDAPANAAFPGFLDDVRQAFRGADVLCFPTHEENQGMSLLEAAWCSIPVVVRDIPTYEGWLTHGKDCLKADDVDGFQEHLEALRDDPGLREKLGRNARAMAREHTLEAVGAELGRVYESLVSSSTGDPDHG